MRTYIHTYTTTAHSYLKAYIAFESSQTWKMKVQSKRLPLWGFQFFVCFSQGHFFSQRCCSVLRKHSGVERHGTWKNTHSRCCAAQWQHTHIEMREAIRNVAWKLRYIYIYCCTKREDVLTKSGWGVFFLNEHVYENSQVLNCAVGACCDERHREPLLYENMIKMSREGCSEDEKWRGGNRKEEKMPSRVQKSINKEES